MVEGEVLQEEDNMGEVEVVKEGGNMVKIEIWKQRDNMGEGEVVTEEDMVEGEEVCLGFSISNCVFRVCPQREIKSRIGLPEA